jgi:general secretion pathway protein G
MILQPRSVALRRRSAFTLLEVLVVVAIILVLASVATVAVLQIQKENKADIAKVSANNLANILRTYMVKHDGNAPQDINELLRYVEGGDPAKLLDPWGQPYQIGSADTTGTGTVGYYIFTVNPETGEEIRSDVRNR